MIPIKNEVVDRGVKVGQKYIGLISNSYFMLRPFLITEIRECVRRGSPTRRNVLCRRCQHGMIINYEYLNPIEPFERPSCHFDCRVELI